MALLFNIELSAFNVPFIFKLLLYSLFTINLFEVPLFTLSKLILIKSKSNKFDNVKLELIKSVKLSSTLFILFFSISNSKFKSSILVLNIFDASYSANIFGSLSIFDNIFEVVKVLLLT